MKKFSILALTLILALSFVACGRNNDQAGNNMTIMPDVMPTLETNIPDPDVDTQMPIYTDGANTDTMEPTGQTNGQTRNGF